MPELPEVEIARRNLERWARGRTIVGAKATASRIFRGTSAAAFSRRLKGRRVAAVIRRGKYLMVRLGDGGALLVHLGMSGKLLRRRAGQPLPERTRASLELDDGNRIHYTSTRLLGRLLVAPEAQVVAMPEWADLGPDPLADRFTPAVLKAALAGTDRPVKPALMDQKRLAGLGNIQTAEALWLARIHPATRASRLGDRALARLARGIERTVTDTIAEWDGDEIAYLSEGAEPSFRVYGRAGGPCPRCRSRIRRVIQGGRATFYCPGCQKRG